MQDAGKMQDLEERVADLKGRMPVHSVKPSMLQELEELEEELSTLREKLRREADS